MTRDLSRDETAREEYIRDAIRGGRLDRLSDDEKRAYAWRLIQSGVDYEISVDEEPLPLVSASKDDHLDHGVLIPRYMTAPVEVQMLWDDRRQRLFACDCAEMVLHFFMNAMPRDPRPLRAIQVARAYARHMESVFDMEYAGLGATQAAVDVPWVRATDAANSAASCCDPFDPTDAVIHATWALGGAREEKSWRPQLEMLLLAYYLGQEDT